MNENDNALNTRINEETQRLVEMVMNEKQQEKRLNKLYQKCLKL